MIAIIAAFAIAVSAKPTLLLYQAGLTSETPPPDVVHPMADGLNHVGKVWPVIYSSSDPMITVALNSGELKELPEKPNVSDLFRVARSIRAAYVCVCSVQREGDMLNGEVTLYKTGNQRPIWSGKTGVSILKEERPDIESATASVASTFVAQLHTTPLKDLAASTEVRTPDPLESPIGTVPTVEPDKTPLASGRKAMSEGRWVEAIALLRDAVDVMPNDVEPRLALIEALRTAGHPFLAAEEAARAITMIPENTALLRAAARSWMEGGQPDKAYDYALQALARDPRDADAIVIVGDLLVGKLEFARAAEKYTEAIAIRKDAEFYFKRAQAYALLEQFSQSVKDMESANAAGLSQDDASKERRYRATAKILEPVFDGLAAGVRNLIREAKPDPALLKSRAESMLSRCDSFIAYMEKLQVPSKFQRSHEQRGLAMNLLRQSAHGLVKYISTRNADDLGDAEILQIEAMRESAAAKARFQLELSSR